MANKNDKKIMELRDQIAEKKSKLGEIKKFIPKTSCVLNMNNNNYNIHTLNKDKCIELMVNINIYLMSANDLEIEDDYILSGYKAEDWIYDLKEKLKDIKKKEEEKKLKLMENKLTKLLSEEKQTELEIEELAKLL